MATLMQCALVCLCTLEVYSLALVLSQDQLFKKQWTIIFTTTTRLTAECVFLNCEARLQTKGRVQALCLYR